MYTAVIWLALDIHLWKNNWCFTYCRKKILKLIWGVLTFLNWTQKTRGSFDILVLERCLNFRPELFFLSKGIRSRWISLSYFAIRTLFFDKFMPLFFTLYFQSFKIVFEHAVQRAIPDEVLKNRVKNIIDSITYLAFQYTTRGLFEKHKIIFTAQVAFQVSHINKECMYWPSQSLLRG